MSEYVKRSLVPTWLANFIWNHLWDTWLRNITHKSN